MLDITCGSFRETDVGKYHFYGPNYDDMTGAWDFPHKMETLDGFRYARILKTVAYIAVDEDAYGQPVIEKWHIRNHNSK